MHVIRTSTLPKQLNTAKAVLMGMPAEKGDTDAKPPAPDLQKGAGLRKGFTTGSAATAAAKAALLALINQSDIDNVTITLPKGGLMLISIKSCEYAPNTARCSVIKDGGDDPDVTHGAEIVVFVHLTDMPGKIIITGGEGVGTVTKPGLGLEIDMPAINPVPRRMISENLTEVGGAILDKGGVRVVISVPKGRELGPKTDNPRIGIKDGISILGTSGIVVPFSTASYAASIRQSLDVAVAMGEDVVVLTTGSRSEEYVKNIMTLPEHCFVQMGDFVGYTVRECNKRRAVIKKAYVVGFIGKLAKMAAGVRQTHVKGSKVDMGFLAGLALEAGAGQVTAGKIRRANTARHALEIARSDGVEGFFDLVCDRVYRHMTGYEQEDDDTYMQDKHEETGRPDTITTQNDAAKNNDAIGQATQGDPEQMDIEVILFDFDGRVLARRYKG